MKLLMLVLAFFTASQAQVVEETIPDVEDDDYVDTVRKKLAGFEANKLITLNIGLNLFFSSISLARKKFL